MSRLFKTIFQTKILLPIIFLIIIFIIWVPVFLTFFLGIDPNLNNKDYILNKKDVGITLYDNNNQVFFSFDGGREKTYAPLSKIPQHTQKAIIASEDKDFYTHSGFSFKAIIRSLIADIKQRDFVYGGSTLTQQLVKNTLLTSNKSLLRKFEEIILAEELEQKFSKDEILEMYLNSAYFGEGAVGINEAAHTYFGKNPEDLTLAESTVITGLLPAPSRLSPLQETQNESKTRQKEILQKMLEQGYISQSQKDQAEQEELKFHSDKKQLNQVAYHFAFMVRDELIKKYGEENIKNSGYKVKTTIDLNWQDFAQKEIKNNVERLASNNVSNSAAVVVDSKTGEVKALVGSKDWGADKFGMVNVATSLRQPGSSFKPIVYATAFERGTITPATILKDQPITYRDPTGYSPPYSPQNYDRAFRGQVSARRALANSLNIPSVEVLSKVGIPAAVEMGQRLGLTTLTEPDKYGLSLTLGSAEVRLVEMTGVYSIFANQGLKNNITIISEIKDKNNQIIYSYQPNPKRVLSPEVAFLISSILSDNKTSAEVFGNVLTISRPAAVKTGTSELYRDSWTVGYTPQLTIGVWVGNNDGAPMSNIAGSLGAAPAWKNLMEQFLKGTPVLKFEAPSNITPVSVCKSNGLRLREASSSAKEASLSASASASVYTEYFIKGTEPLQFCNNPVATSSARRVSPTPIGRR